MLNRYFSTSDFNFSLTVRTLRYAYPESLVKVTYKVRGSHEKAFFLRVGYFGGHILSYKSKRELSKEAQIELSRTCCGLVKYNEAATNDSINFAERTNQLMLSKFVPHV